ncbi:site-2 protease family protein [Actinomadura rugatobispora]|uniref:Zinc metalloprotease n=1 Tax=Actinomadura rugatobispora TaxID=1994 RepID=A0ABW1A1D8_9ACTN|nr:site-2 protease family protein [Actinomadura rugatobispora]
MKQSLRLGRIAGIPFGLHWSVLAILALVALTLADSVLPTARPGLPTAAYVGTAVPVAVLFFTCLGLHELAHSLVARRSGVRVKAITLWMLGGVSELEDEASTPRTALAIALAGPAASLALGLLAGAGALAARTLEAPALISFGLAWLAFMNVVLAAFNMLPGAPLDGGRVLAAVLWRAFGDRARADRVADRAGAFLGQALAIAGIYELLVLRSGGGLWLILIGWFLHSTARIGAAARRSRAALRGLRVRDVMTPDPLVAPGWTTVTEFAERLPPSTKQAVFPVVDLAGSVTGVVPLDLLARRPGARPAAVRLDTIAIRPRPEHLMPPGAPATELLDRRPLPGGLLAVVVEDDHPIGIVTVNDIDLMVRRAALPSAPPAHGTADGTQFSDGPYGADSARTSPEEENRRNRAWHRRAGPPTS